MQFLSFIEQRFVINTDQGDLQIVLLILIRSSYSNLHKRPGVSSKNVTHHKNITAWAMNDNTSETLPSKLIW